MAEAAFSDDGKYFSAISTDGRLRIWDTETNVLKQEYTPDLHLTSPPKCLRWILVGNKITPRDNGKRKASISEQESQCIALGTTNGKILIYSVSQAKVETVLVNSKNSEISESRITSIDWHRKYGLHSCNKDGLVHEWDISNAVVRNKYNVNIDSKNKQASVVNAIKIVPHDYQTPAKFLVTASWQVCVWRLHDSHAVLIQTLGHNTAAKPLLTLSMLNGRSWLIEGSQNERLLSFYDITISADSLPQVNGEGITPNKKKRRKSNVDPVVTTSQPTYNFVLEDAPKNVNVCVRKLDGGVQINVAAATRSGVVHYYGHMLNGTSTKPIKPSVTVQVTTEDAIPMPLQCCQFLDRGDGELLLGYEATAGRLLFERIQPELKSKTQVLIRGEPIKSKKDKQTDEITRTRSDSLKDEDRVTYLEPMGGVARKRTQPGAKVEVPMEDRLANLALDTKDRSKAPVSQNLTKLLMQGLHSKDKSLILMVLQKNDPAVALRTVSNLPANYVYQLLEQITDMAARRTSQCASVCTWLSALLRTHSALLLATLNSRQAGDQLTELLAIFIQRRSHLCQLLNLKGRMDMTITQRTANDDIGNEEDAVLEYNDDTSSESELEAPNSESDNASWDDDKFGSGASERDSDQE